jgi:predicted GNAT family acetyltransferase
MQVQHYRDTALFLERAGPFLLRAEAENSLFLGMGGQPAVLDERCYLSIVERGTEVVACAVRTPPFGLVITRADTSSLDALLEDLIGKYESLPSVLGPEPTVSALAERWSKRAGTRVRSLMQMRVFEARQVQVPASSPPGRLRCALESDLATVTAWVVAFHQEAQTGSPLDPVRATREAVAKQRLFIWDDRDPMSIATYAGRTDRSARIGLAYTPPEHRRRGYASACVAALTQRLLGEGLVFCSINADLANPTTNKIYPAIGYRPVCDTSNIDFEVQPGT